MEARELRIGNYYFYQSFGNVIKLDSEMLISLLGDGLLDVHKIQPIPLTEDWLKRFGFEYLDFRDKYQIDSFELQLQNNEVGEWYVMDYDIFPTIKYVHQLQNLFYALTGKELTLNK